MRRAGSASIAPGDAFEPHEVGVELVCNHRADVGCSKALEGGIRGRPFRDRIERAFGLP
jgi:hypothetical protein